MSDQLPFDPRDLESLGLNSYESKTYLSLLSSGLSTARDIIKDADVPSGRIYDILSSLEHKGLVERQDSRPKRYRGTDPQVAIRNLLDLKDQEYQTIKDTASVIESQLSEIFTSRPKESTFWSVALEEEEMKVRINKKILEAERELLMYLNLKATHAYFSPESRKWLSKGIEELIRRKVDLKLILGGITKEEFIKEYLPHYEPFLGMTDKIEVRITDVATNNFDIIDKERVLFKVPNPVDINDIFAMIYLWKKPFAEKLETKFQEIWVEAIPLESAISSTEMKS
jgi:sugar-specific transcriptional regulator TrmB